MNNVIKLTKQGAIGIVKMEDRESKNTFSPAFINSLKKVFNEIAEDNALKVIIICGFDNYFCCGGTQEELIGILENKLAFEDYNFHDLLINCKLPVIAAMQGHAIGGGFVFGCYADMLVMAEECIYSTNFMKFGFTPGMGATLVIPYKFGPHLGCEMLYTAKNYYGKELKERCSSINVVKKKDVFDTALNFAKELVNTPALSLVLLKEELNKVIRLQLPEAIRIEQELHKKTFAQPGIRARINEIFESK